MRKILFIILYSIISMNLSAQDTRYVGTWKWHYDSPYDDAQNGLPPHDEYIRIDFEDGKVYVRLKFEGKDGYGRPMQSRLEAEDVNVNSDGSISFNRYYCKKEYDNDERLWLTVWTHYIVKYEGGRLFSSEILMGQSYDKSGNLIKEDLNHHHTQKIYYNEKDNW